MTWVADAPTRVHYSFIAKFPFLTFQLTDNIHLRASACNAPLPLAAPQFFGKVHYDIVPRARA